MPCAAPMMRPDAHRVMAKNDSLLTHMDFGQGTPGSKDALGFARHFVMISLNKMDRFAAQTLAIGRHLFNAAHAKIPKEIERIVWLDVRVHPIRDVRIHLFRARKRTIAIADDVEVPEVKIGGELRIGHVPIMKDRLPKRLFCPARMQTREAENIAVTTDPADPGGAVASWNEPGNSPRSADAFCVNIIP
jgi:hypothetical protein